jgi:hypothetical protein
MAMAGKVTYEGCLCSQCSLIDLVIFCTRICLSFITDARAVQPSFFSAV